MNASAEIKDMAMNLDSPSTLFTVMYPTIPSLRLVSHLIASAYS